MGTLTEDEINDILESGDPDQIDRIMSSLEETDDGYELKDDAEQSSSTADHSDIDAEQEAESAATEQAKEAQQEEAKPTAIEGKHGTHTIPYSELENERKARQAAETRLRELEQENASRGKIEQRLELLTKQLQDNGLDPETLPEDLQWTDELKSSLIEDYGDAGKLMVALKDQLDQLKDNSSQTTQPASPEPAGAAKDQEEGQAAFLRNETLVNWSRDNPERWDQATKIDQILQADPKFKTASFDDRYAEVVRRVSAMYGETPPAASNGAAKQSVADAKAKADAEMALPNSLTELGVGATAPDRPLIERMAEMDIEDIQAEMDNMTDSQRNALLAQLS